MTVADISKSLTYEELIGWSGFYALKAEEEQRSRDQAQTGATRRVQHR